MSLALLPGKVEATQRDSHLSSLNCSLKKTWCIASVGGGGSGRVSLVSHRHVRGHPRAVSAVRAGSVSGGRRPTSPDRRERPGVADGGWSGGTMLTLASTPARSASARITLFMPAMLEKLFSSG